VEITDQDVVRARRLVARGALEQNSLAEGRKHHEAADHIQRCAGDVDRAGIVHASVERAAAKVIVGTWTLVSVEAAGMDGSKSQPYGANPVGIIIFDASGHYSNLTSRAGLPKFASNNRTQGTPKENKAIVQGSIADFGKYSVNEADKASSTLSTAPTPTGTAPNRNAQSL
jgi:Lipocalin-like domain